MTFWRRNLSYHQVLINGYDKFFGTPYSATLKLVK